MASSGGDLGWHRHWIAKKGKKIQVFTLLMEVDTGIPMDKSKTIGTVMSKNNKKILMVAHSGYSSTEKRDEGCLDTAKWNALALNYLSKQMNFRFRGNIRDNNGPITDEQRGRAHAGHVEILLASWYVVDLFARHIGPSSIAEKDAIPHLKRLRDISLGDERIAFITIDSEPCRPCLQYLNKLSRHTGIIFLVSGSQGVGPVQFRVQGERRSDIVNETFLDSDDDDDELMPDISDNTTCPSVPQPDGPDATTVANRGLVEVETRRACREPIRQWLPQDAEELISSYKKKTPVYEFPGYATAPRPGLATTASKQGARETDDDFIMIDDDKSPESNYVMIDEEEDDDDEEVIPIPCETQDKEWDDLGGGLQVERPQGPQEPRSDNGAEGFPGFDYAKTAYEAIEPASKQEQKTGQDTGMLKGHLDARLGRFRHDACANSKDESYFKKKYAILRPRDG